MTQEQWTLFYAFGGLLFMALLLLSSPSLVEPVGWGVALTIVGVVQYDEWTIRRETRNIDSEHERL